MLGVAEGGRGGTTRTWLDLDGNRPFTQESQTVLLI